MSKAKKIIDMIEQMPGVYDVVYYEKDGEHGSAGAYPKFEWALDAAKKLAEEEKGDPRLWFVGVDGPDKFAVVLVRDEYLTKRVTPADFANKKAYDKWMAVAKKALETGEPQIGKQ